MSLQSCLTLCDPIDNSPPGSPIPGILQARTLVAISFSNAWKGKVKVKSLSHAWLLVTPWTAAYQAPPPMGFSRQEYWSGLPLPSPGDTEKWLKCTQIHNIYKDSVLSLKPLKISSVSSVAQSCLILCDPIDCNTPGFPVHHQLLELTQTRVHWVSDAIQPSHPLSFPSPLASSFS